MIHWMTMALALSIVSTVAQADDAPIVRMVRSPYGPGLFIPNDDKPHPAVLLLHGSEGGLASGTRLYAEALAAQGYVAFAFCYAGCASGADSDIYRPNRETIAVDLKKTADALTWLAKSKYVNGKKVALYGVSRGAEQALLLASLLAKDTRWRSPDAVAVHAPSDIIVPGFNWYWRDSVCSSGKSWNQICGTPPPADEGHHPVAWLWSPAPSAVTPGKRIEVENIKAPIFITHGDRDEVWSVDRTHRIQKSLEAVGLHSEVHIFRGEGHILRLEAGYEADVMLLSFLKRTLTEPHATSAK